MNEPIILQGVEQATTITHIIPPDFYIQNNISINAKIYPIVDIDSLKDYPEENQIGGKYASRSELVYRFILSNYNSFSFLSGVDHSLTVEYKDMGYAEFVFSHFVIAYDKSKVYAVYKYSTTMS